MGFAAIAVGIAIDTASGTQAMHTAAYAYALEICSIKTLKNELHLPQLIEF